MDCKGEIYMRCLIVPQAFKGTASAMQVAAAIQDGLLRAFPTIESHLFPIADGGDGTLDALLFALGGSERTSVVTGTFGAQQEVVWGIAEEGRVAIIEMAKVCGLANLPFEQRNPMNATTFGVGELILEALDRGIRKFIVGIGGSATQDCGMGALQALGVLFKDQKGQSLPFGGGALTSLADLDLSHLDSRLKKASFILLCDVSTPFSKSANMYAAQKGATSWQIEELNRGFLHFANIVEKKFDRSVLELPCGGAGGGIGMALHTFLNGKMILGTDYILDLSAFDEALYKSDCVIIGEGKFDEQTLENKGPWRVLQRAKAKGIPVFAIVGQIQQGFNPPYAEGLTAILPLHSQEIINTDRLSDTWSHIAFAAEQLMRIYLPKNFRGGH
ncbi:hypothetical protein pah_c012o023 [Parachlamydia acanthamoebae str. Hall's coccus]|jgi:glycerate kinase|nr:hypothetical protein pah_c012o023 [Parachlamydia acanthamoebae str. Hall's coccus]